LRRAGTPDFAPRFKHGQALDEEVEFIDVDTPVVSAFESSAKFEH
jgi:hypothetical protein